MKANSRSKLRQLRVTQFVKGLPLAGMVGLALVLFWLFVAVAGPFITPYPVGAFVTEDVFEGASAHHWLGSDYLGRDVLSRVLSGASYTIGLALAGAILAVVIGTGLALFSTVSSRWLDEGLSRFMDTLISIPSRIFALVLVAAFGSSLLLLLGIGALIYMPGNYRIARSLAVNLNQMDYVQVARARGERNVHIAAVEILPNMIDPLLADFALRFMFIVLLLASLSFLGLGVQPPNADLGSLVRENVSGLPEGALAIVVPSVAIATITVGLNLLIDALPTRGRPVPTER